MKNRILAGILALLTFFPISKLAAQADESQYYTFQKDSAPYVTMDTAKMISANQGVVWVEDKTIKIPIGFNLFSWTMTLMK